MNIGELLLGVKSKVLSGETYLPAYDAMGNVHAMIKGSDGSVAAAYDGARQGGDGQTGRFARRAQSSRNRRGGGRARQYDAFGRTIRESGPYAASNRFRFSTKYTDVETELIYFGLRYYSPTLGRFITRDPIGEQGGINLYAFVGNNGVNGYDFLGMDPTVQNVPHNAPDPEVMGRARPDLEYIGDGRWYDPANDHYLVYVGERGGHQFNAYPDEGLGFTESFGLGTAAMDDASNAAFYESLGTEIEEMNARGRAIFGSDGDSVSWSPGGVRGRAADGSVTMNPSVLSVSRSGSSKGAGGSAWVGDVAMDIAGFLDPTPTVDLINAGRLAAQGRYVEAGLTSLGVIPVAGDIVGKGAKWIYRGIRNLLGAKKPLLPDAAWAKNAPHQVAPGTTQVEHFKYNEDTGRLERSVVEYDEYGRQVRRTDFDNHGYGKPNSPDYHSDPHTHDYKYGPGYGPKGKETRTNQ